MPNRKLPVGPVVRAAMKLGVRNLGWVVLFTVIPNLLIAGLLSPIMLMSVLGDKRVPVWATPIAVALGMACVAVASAAAIDLLYRRYRSLPALPLRAVATGARRLLKLIGFALLQLMLTLGLVLLFMIGRFAFGHLSPVLPEIHGGVVFFLTLTAVVGAIVLGLFGSMLALVSIVICVIESLGPILSIERAFELLRGNWWRAVGAMLIVWLSVFIATSIGNLILAFADRRGLHMAVAIGGIVILGLIVLVVAAAAMAAPIVLFALLRDFEDDPAPYAPPSVGVA